MVFTAKKFRAHTGALGLVFMVALVLGATPAYGGTGRSGAAALGGTHEGVTPAAVPFASLGTPAKINVPTPKFLAVSPDGSRAFVASEGGDFSVIDVATDTVTSSTTLNNTSAMKVSPDGSKVFLGTLRYPDGYGVTFVNAATATATAVVPVSNAVQDLAVAGDGSKVYATTRGPKNSAGSTPGTLEVIDVATAAVQRVIPLSNGPSQMVLTKDGSKIYVTNTENASISVINTATNTLASTIADVATEDGSLSPDGSKIYYPVYGAIAVVGVSSDTVVGRIPTATVASAPVFTPDGKRAFTVDKAPDRREGSNVIIGASFLAEIDFAKNSLTPVDLNNGGPSMYSGALNITMSPDGTRLYVIGSWITVLNLPSLNVSGTVTLEPQASPGQLTMVPDGSKGYLLTGNQHDYMWAIPTPRPHNAWKDYNSDGATDVLARDSAGTLWLYPGNANSGWLPRSQVGTGWNVMNLIVTAGDFNGDGISDVLARDASGHLWLYPGDGHSNWLPRSKVGVGWNAMTAVVAPGDFDGDGHADVVARDSAGDLWLYPGNGSGGWLPRTKIGTGWNGMTAIMGPSNNVNPGNDILARDTAGTLWLYERDTSGQWQTPRLVGVGWNVMTAIVTVGDVNGDDVPDVLARDASGLLWLYPGEGYGGYAPRIQVGTGWNVMSAIV